MRITRIDFVGQPGLFATAQRRSGTKRIEITILTPDYPDGLAFDAPTDEQRELFDAAKAMALHLEGNDALANDYHRELLRLCGK